MNILVLTSRQISGEQLRAALGDADPAQDTEVMVVAPALHESALRFWVSDADEAIKKAQKVSRETAEQLGEAGIAAHGDSGEGDPMEAIADALRDFAADRIILFTRPESHQLYREDVDEAEVRQRFGLPVEHVLLSPTD